MFTVNISSETADALFRDILVQDHNSLKSSIKNLEGKLNELKSWEIEDLEANRKYVTAIETLFTYYLPFEMYQRIINENSNCQ